MVPESDAPNSWPESSATAVRPPRKTSPASGGGADWWPDDGPTAAQGARDRVPRSWRRRWTPLQWPHSDWSQLDIDPTRPVVLGPGKMTPHKKFVSLFVVVKLAFHDVGYPFVSASFAFPSTVIFPRVVGPPSKLAVMGALEVVLSLCTH